MFSISLKQEPYLTYILSDQEALSRLEIVPERGGIITRWKIQGQDILYLDEERFADPQLSVRGGIPILFPICGNLPDNTYTHNNQQYSLKQHGFARDLPWQVSEKKTDTSASLTLSLESNAQTLSVYPFEFQLNFTYQLQGNRLRIYQCYTNNSSEKMPFSTGLHPYFFNRDKNQLTLDIPSAQYQNQQTKEIFPFNGELDFDCEEIDAAFQPITRHTASISDRQRRLKLTLSYCDHYSTLVFWTVKGKDYVCLEPWTAPRNALNTGESLIYLDSGATCETVVEMDVSYF